MNSEQDKKILDLEKFNNESRIPKMYQYKLIIRLPACFPFATKASGKQIRFQRTLINNLQLDFYT